MRGLRGVYNILSTPFSEDGTVNERSLRRLASATVGAGVDGITVLGVAGEVQKLTDRERLLVFETVVAEVGDRVPVLVGSSRDGTLATVSACREAEARGAAGVMVAPPTFVGPGDALTEHYRTIGESIGIPIVLQDFPPVNGVAMSPRQMADLVEEVPSITTVKLEDTPTPVRTAQTLGLLGKRATILGGLGGVYLLDELRSGASGTMTGFAYPEILMSIWKAWESGDSDAASETYRRYLPLLVFEGQPKIGLAIRKEILRLRGLIEHATVRRPGPFLDPTTAGGLADTLARLDVRQRFDSGAPGSGEVAR